MRRNPVPNRDGEQETVEGVVVVHRFVEAEGAIIPVRWHLVEGGDPAKPVLLFLHGNPESWRSWEPQLPVFADRFRVIAVDLKGYGQSDKRPGDWRWKNCAEELRALLDVLSVDRTTIVSHDRGSVLADYFAGSHPDRVLGYVRMQQVCHIWKADLSPQGVYFADPTFGPFLFGDPDYYFYYRIRHMLKGPVPEVRLEKLKQEMSYPGTAEAVVRYYQASTFERERLDRILLFPRMNFPVMLVQAELDDFQPPFYYAHPDLPATACFPNATLEWIPGCGHYTNLERPDLVTEAIERFLATRDEQSQDGTSTAGDGRRGQAPAEAIGRE